MQASLPQCRKQGSGPDLIPVCNFDQISPEKLSSSRLKLLSTPREMVCNRDTDAQETVPDSPRLAFLSGTPSHKFWQCPSLTGPHFGDFLLKGSAIGLWWEWVLLSCPPSLSLKTLPLPKMRSEISLWYSLPSMYWLPASCPRAISHHPWYGPLLQATRSLGNGICPYHPGWHLPPLLHFHTSKYSPSFRFS